MIREVGSLRGVELLATIKVLYGVSRGASLRGAD